MVGLLPHAGPRLHGQGRRFRGDRRSRYLHLLCRTQEAGYHHFVAWRAQAFLVIPNWFMLYSSDNGLMNGPIIYYGLLVAPFLFYASLQGIRVIGERTGPRRERVVFWLATLIFLVQLGNSR